FKNLLVPVRPGRHLGWSKVALLTVGFSRAENAVGQTVVQGARPRQNMVDIDRTREQHCRGDHRTGVDTATVKRITRIELFPKLEKLSIEAIVRLPEFTQERGAALGVPAIPSVSRDSLSLLLLALIELTC